MRHREISLDFPSRKIVYQFYFLMVVILGVGAAYLLLRIPGDLENSLILGLSPERLILFGTLLVFIFLGGVLFSKSWVDQNWLISLDDHVSSLSNDNRWSRILFICFTILLFGSVFLLTVYQESFFTLAPPDGDPEISYNAYFTDLIFTLAQPYLIRLQPLVLLGIALSIQTIVFLPLVLFGIGDLHTRLKSQKIYHIVGIYAIFLILWGWSGWTQLKLEPDDASFGWYPLGSPILDTQLFLVILIGTALVGLGYLITSNGWKTPLFVKMSRSNVKIDIALGLLIWVIAAGYWSLFPYEASQFVSAPRYPNFEHYPNSDALLWDTTAQSLLVGEGFKTGSHTFARRPVQAVFLAVLYTVIGQDYETVTLVQSAIFAVFPALVYFVTKVLHNRLSALLAGLLVLFREGNAIALANKITVTHSRLVMAEMPTAIGVAVFVLLMISWLRKPERRYLLPLILGGLLGAFMLVRIEVVAYLPLFLLFTGFLHFRKPKSWFTNSLLVIGGLILFLAPWVWRNWRLTGQIFLEVPDNRVGYFLARFGSEESNFVPDSPDIPLDVDANRDNSGFPSSVVPTSVFPEIQAAGSEKEIIKAETSTGEKTSPSETQTAPGYRRFVDYFFRHFFHNQVQGILIFPDGFRILDSVTSYLGHYRLNRFLEACCQRENYVQRFEFWKWLDWEGSLPVQAVPSILFSLFLISVGFVKIGQKNGVKGFFPILVVYTSYAVNSAARISGGRFVLLVDWVWIVVYSIGLAQVIVWFVSSWFGKEIPKFQIGDKLNRIPEKFPIKKRGAWLQRYLMAGLVIFLFGATLPLAERMAKPRYTARTIQTWIAELLKSESLKGNNSGLSNFIEQFVHENGEVRVGRALYPRYYPAGEGEPGSDYSFSLRNFQHFNFYLIGSQNGGVQLAVKEAPGVAFPNATDVLVLGCQTDELFDAVVVFVRSSGVVLSRSPFPTIASCPLPEIE